MFTKAVGFTLFCSLALHGALLFLPERNTGTKSNNQEKGTELHLTLARAQNPTVMPTEPVIQERPVPEPLKPSSVKPPPPKPLPSKPLPSKPLPSKPIEIKKPEPVVSTEKFSSRKIAKPKEPIKELIKEPVKEQIKPASVPVVTAENNTKGNNETTQQPANAISSNALPEDAIKIWQTELQQRINRNRHYPRQALLRGIEDDVKIRAVIRPDGTLKEAEVLSGHRSLKASSLKTLRQSLPYPPPAVLSAAPSATPSGSVRENVTITFTIKYLIR